VLAEEKESDFVSASLNKVEDLEKVVDLTKQEPTVESSSSCRLSTALPISVKQVVDLLYWKDVKVSAALFSLLMLNLLALNYMSAVLVFSYLSSTMLCATFAIKTYYFIIQSVYGTQQEVPFQKLLDADINISKEKAQKYQEIFVEKFNCFLNCARDLILVKNVSSSIKLGLFCWSVGYIGIFFNGLTIITLACATAFTFPAIYEKNKTEIDKNMLIIQQHCCAVCSKVKSFIPGVKPKAE